MKWREYSRSSRNRLLKALIDRVELRGANDIEAIIYWKAGFRQPVIIHRKKHKSVAERLWTEEEEKTLGRLFPCSPQDAVMAALPGRSWKSITLKAGHLGLSRQRSLAGGQEESSEHSDTRVDSEGGSGPSYITGSVRRETSLQAQNLNLHQRSSSGGLRGILTNCSSTMAG